MAYMISLAVENYEYVKTEVNIKMDRQFVIGLLHVGLSPIFYKQSFPVPTSSGL